MSRFPPALLVGLLAAGPAAAHPLPNLRFDRETHVRVSADAVTVRYALEMNDWTLVLDGKNLVPPGDLSGVTGSLDYARRYAARKAPLLADNLRATLDGRELPFRLAAPPKADRARDHLRFDFVFRADLRPPPGRHALKFEDQNFEDRSGAVTLTLAPATAGVELDDIDDPADLRNRSPLDLSPADAQRLRRASAVLVVPAAPAPSDPAATPEPAPAPAPADPPPSVLADLTDRGLSALFDTGYGLGALVLMAFGFGAAHAFTPGHGKTLVAAYLVGERGTARHALLLGLTTTLAHTGSVLAVAVVLQQVYGDRVPAVTEAVLKVVGGLLVAGVGGWLFVQRVRGRADHVHLFADRHAPAGRPSSTLRVVMLGLGGGIVPCWDAVLLLLVAVSAGRLGTAVPLLVAFSAGLAAVLVALGLAVVYAQRAGGRRFGDARWFRALPIVSAVFLVALGLWFARAGVQTLSADPSPPHHLTTPPPH